MEFKLLEVVIVNHGCDHALYLNDKLIMSVDPDFGDPLAPLEQAKVNLSDFFKTPVTRIEWPPESDSWNWDEVTESLRDEGII